MTIANFKKRVGAIIDRDPASFIVDSYDNMLAAMNEARMWAQREHTFHLLKQDVFASITSGGINWMTECTDAPGGSAVVMKQIDGVWNYTTETIGGSPVYVRTTYYDYGLLSDLRLKLRKISSPYEAMSNPQQALQTQMAYTQGQRLYLSNTGVATDVLLEGVAFLPDLTDASAPDLFLTYFSDWLVYGTITALNHYLKADQRFPIDVAVADRLWRSVIKFDGDVAMAGQSVDLE